MPLRTCSVLFAASMVLASAALAAPSDDHAKKSDAAIKKGIDFLRSTQAADGSWSAKPGPAVTGLVLTIMLDQPDTKRDDPAVIKAVDYILKHVQKDGGIYMVQNGVGMLENYNTSICVSALSRLGNDPKIAQVVKQAKEYLKSNQWNGQKDPDGKSVGEDHPFYGGTGYGSHGRPDGSNLNVTLQAFIDTGSDCKDPEVLMAVQFFSRLQGSKANTKFFDKIVNDGGAIYSTSVDKTKIGVPQSQAGEIVDADGKSKLRTYGSMTYAMFRSYVYAKLDKSDPRVIDALVWIRRNYTLERNPGMSDEAGQNGYYYYLVTFARALSAYGEPVIETADGKKHNWADDLIDKLAAEQSKNGSWANEQKRWLEGEADLVTAYALTALQAARR